jgi:tRNA(fMet)-specific endonuclease VapC
MRFLLDTNIVIALLDPSRRARVTKHLTSHAPGDVVTSMIVAHELYFCAANSARPDENCRRLDAIFAELPPLLFTMDDARASGSVRAQLKRAGLPIGPYDVLIGGQALARGLTLVTNNSREFARVGGLAVADWLS